MIYHSFTIVIPFILAVKIIKNTINITFNPLCELDETFLNRTVPSFNTEIVP